MTVNHDNDIYIERLLTRLPLNPIDPGLPLPLASRVEVGAPRSEGSIDPGPRRGQLRDLMGEQLFGPSISHILPLNTEGRRIATPLAGGVAPQGVDPAFRLTALAQDPDASGRPSFMVVEAGVPLARRRKDRPWSDGVGVLRSMPTAPITNEAFVADWALPASHIHASVVPAVLTNAESGRYSASFVSSRATSQSFVNTLRDPGRK